MKTQCPSNRADCSGHHFTTLLLLLLGLLSANCARANDWTETKKTVYIIRADFPDLTGEAISQAELTTRFNLTVSNQLYQMSYGKTWVEATVSSNVVRLPGNTNSYAPDNWDALHSDGVAAFNAQNTGINLSNYNVVAVAIKYIGLSSPGRVASPFTFPFWRMWLSQTLRPGVIGGGLSAEVITHEMGHIYGLPHANAWIGPLVGGNAENAGDIFDIMGTGYLQLSQAHFNPWAKSRLNWLTATQWTDVTASGNYRIYRFDHHATTASTSRGLRIPKAAPNDYYWVGYRRAFTNNASLSNGAYLLWGTPAQSLLIDTTPNSSTNAYQDRLDSALAIGQTYSDPAANIQITPLGNGGTAPDEWLDVNVQFGVLSPTVTTLLPTSLTTNAATLNASANPNGLATIGYFEWGTNTSYGQTTALTALGSGNSAVAFSNALIGLVAGQTYHYRAVASNAAEVVYGTNVTFTTPTPPAAATVTTLAATVVRTNSARLNGSVNPNGSGTIGFFQWGTNTTYGQTTASSALGNGSNAVSFSRTLNGLVAGRTYYFRAAASNAAGVVYGANMTFTTPMPPAVTTVAATAVTTNGATLNGSGNPNGSAALGYFQWGTNTSYGATSGPVSLGSGSLSLPFSNVLSSLVPGRTYHYRAVASNSVGIAYGADLAFTTLTPLTPTAFTNVPIAGLPGVAYGSTAWGDFDNDGHLDFLLTGYSGSTKISQLWRNTGSGFSNVTSQVAPGLPRIAVSFVAWGDYDNDGRLDFLLTGTTNDFFSGFISQLWRNTGNGFSNVTGQVAPGLPGIHTGSAAWADYDNDGRLDFFLTGSTAPGLISQVWRNTGNGFTNVTSQVAPGLRGLHSGSVAWGDYDNDGRLDFLLTGSTNGGFNGAVSQLWRNTGSGFSNVTSQIAVGLPAVSFGSVAWGDYDNDRRLDFLLTGTTNNATTGLIFQLWRNTGNGFSNVTTQVAPGLPGVVQSSVAWGDYDNDGRLDFLVTGFNGSTNIFQLWQNTGNGFSNVPIAGPLGLGTQGSVAWGDYDNDSRLDFFITGETANVSQLWRNVLPTFNAPPSAPAGLSAQVYPNSVTLNWLPASDDHTQSSGLSYNLILATTSNSVNLASPMANPINGFRRVVQLGGANQRTSWTFTNLPPAPIYYWSVQAVDTAFAGGPFAPVQSLLNVVFTTTDVSGSAQPTFAFTGTTGHIYTIEGSNDLVVWTVAGTATESPAGSGNFVFVDVSAFPGARFYRIRY
jgi:hypothetical protein